MTAVVFAMAGAAPAWAAAPVVTSFTPTTAAVGDPVTLQVTNPDTDTNTVLINGVAATVMGKTSTSLTVVVPAGAGGGKITVTTPGGTATSSADLFVVPSGTAVADVSGTGRLTVGTRTTLSVPAGKAVMRLFDGTDTDRFSVTAENASPSLCAYDLRLYDTKLSNSGTASCWGSTGWIETVAATGVAGARTLVLKNTSTTAGTVDVGVWSVTDANLGALPLDNTAKTVALSTPGQNGYLTFAGTAGQRVSVQASNGGTGFGCCEISWGIYGSDGNLVGSKKYGNNLLDPTTLPKDGTYQLRLDPNDFRTGSITLNAWIVAADANLGVLPLDGTAKTVAISTPGQNGYLTFAGTAGQRVALQVTDPNSFTCCYITWGLYAADGSQVGASKVGNDYLDAVTLPSTGTYQVRLDPADTRTGSVTVAAYAASTDVNLGVLALDGTNQTVSISNPGQNGYLTFAGTAGQRVAIQTTNASAAFGCCYVLWGLYAPDGTKVGSTKVGNDYLDATTLPSTGTYQVRLDPADTRTGSITFAAFSAVADTNAGALVLDGTTKNVTISNAGQNGYATFAGTAGQRVAIQTTNASAAFGCCYLYWGLYAPDGSQLGWTRVGNDYLDATTLPSTGTYQVRFDPADIRTGSVTVGAWTVPADTNLGALTTDGVTKTVTLSSVGQNGYLTMAGTSGQTIAITATNASTGFGCCYVYWSLKRPDGITIATGVSNGSSSVKLATTGTFQLYVDPIEYHTGSITFAAAITP
ncbi:IPT/TIG domain-containing protein [Actinoplanes sp. HUAS TT8]|uniref:IPT/TIG domain-containing protein n=1 Tax=Actinoplanes sp. HUAS TT8 TaxID=3447453 RepID=UPI003F51FBB6